MLQVAWSSCYEAGGRAGDVVVLPTPILFRDGLRLLLVLDDVFGALGRGPSSGLGAGTVEPGAACGSPNGLFRRGSCSRAGQLQQ